MGGVMRCPALLVVGVVWAISARALAQSDAVAPPSKASAGMSAKQTAPIQTQFKADKVHFLANGQEELESASSVSPGDVIEYAAVHRNVSQRRLLNVDFAIPIPWGTTLWQGSVQPAHGRLVLASVNDKDAKHKNQARVVWRVARLDPAQSVSLKLRVSIDPDPTRSPAQPVNPFAPRTPELRRP